MAGRATSYSDYYKSNSSSVNSTADDNTEENNSIPGDNMVTKAKKARKTALQRRLNATRMRS